MAGSLEEAGFSCTTHVFPAGEGSKSMGRAEDLCRGMIREGHDRSSFVVALGGGVTGDLGGFVASVFYRGIPFVQVPTTIMAQVDSAVGGKTGVNTPEGKNLVGSFHQPALVAADPATLATLSSREYREGFAEVVKHAAIRDAGMLEDLAGLDPADQSLPEELIARNVAIKARIVEADERETGGQRALLNFGHTIGHAIEASVPYGELLHGEAISLGTRAALALSRKRAGLAAEDEGKVLDLLERFGLPLVLPEGIRTEGVMEKLARDKKFSGGRMAFVLLEKAGKAFVSRKVTAEDVREAVEGLRGEVVVSC